MRGDLQIDSKGSRKMWDWGNLEPHRQALKARGAAGRPEACAPVALKDASDEATRNSIAGTAGRCGTGATWNLIGRRDRQAGRRGNPKLARRQRRRMRATGQLETPSPAQPEDVGLGQPGTSSAGVTGKRGDRAT